MRQHLEPTDRREVGDSTGAQSADESDRSRRDTTKHESVDVRRLNLRLSNVNALELVGTHDEARCLGVIVEARANLPVRRRRRFLEQRSYGEGST